MRIREIIRFENRNKKNNDKKRVISYWNNIKDNYITDIKKIIDDYS